MIIFDQQQQWSTKRKIEKKSCPIGVKPILTSRHFIIFDCWLQLLHVTDAVWSYITINILLTFLPESCKTLGTDSEPCVFPFIYEGVRYNQCTSQDAAEGAVWCATQVSTNGTVIEGRWGDCTEGCPGSSNVTSIHFTFGFIILQRPTLYTSHEILGF